MTNVAHRITLEPNVASLNDGTVNLQVSQRPRISLRGRPVGPYEKAEVVPRLEELATHVKRLPDSVIEKLGIDRRQLDHYANFAVTANPFAVVNQYEGTYWLKFDELRLSGDKETLGKLHHKIDQVYARLIGYRSTFAPIDIPIGEFRIRSSIGIEAKYWLATAGLVMFAESIANQKERDAQKRITATERWREWVRQIRDQGPASPEMEAKLRFTENILRDWNGFRKSWDNPAHHITSIWKHSGTLAKYAKHDTPEKLHSDAGKEWGPLFGNWEGDAELYDLIRGAPGWFKIAHRHILESKLRAQYGAHADLSVLNPDKGGPRNPLR